MSMMLKISALLLLCLISYLLLLLTSFALMILHECSKLELMFVQEFYMHIELISALVY